MTLDRDACPSQDVLIEAASPGADRSVRGRVADHLIACAACADEFRLLQALAPWASEQAHLVAPAGALPGTAMRRNQAVAWAYAAAAVLAVLAVGLTVEVRRLAQANRTLTASFAEAAADRRRTDQTPATAPGQEARLADQQQKIRALEERLRATEAPDLNPPIIDLDAADSLRSAGRAERTTIPPGTGPVVFVLNTAHVQPGAAFEVDIVDAANRVAWTGSGLKQSADGTLTLAVPRSMVERSSRVRLYSRAATLRDQRKLVEEYVLPARR
jgi:hypothetical protein